MAVGRKEQRPDGISKIAYKLGADEYYKQMSVRCLSVDLLSALVIKEKAEAEGTTCV